MVSVGDDGVVGSTYKWVCRSHIHCRPTIILLFQNIIANYEGVE